MTTVRSPRSRFYDGALYAKFLDPSLTRLHRVVAGFVKSGDRVLDVGCGTGNLAFLAAEKAGSVVGLELSPAMVEFAETRRRRAAVQNVSFVLGDAASALSSRPDRSFDTATMVLALHEMPSVTRGPVLRELGRLANRILVVDFRVPMPRNLPGLLNRTAELTSGREHFRAFRDFNRRGGVPGIAAECGLSCNHRRFINGATFEISELSL